MAKLTFLCMLITSLAFSQNSHEEMIQRFMEQRDRIMGEMLKSFDSDDFFSQDDFFSDDVKDFFGEATQASVDIEQKPHGKDGLKVVITPQSKDVKLEVEETPGALVVKVKTLKEDKSENNGQRSLFRSSSISARHIPIPSGLILEETQAQGDSLVYLFKRGEKKKIDVEVKPGDKAV